MKAENWTSGPWFFDGDCVISQKGFTIADWGTTNWHNNARFIAASPEVYDALAGMVSVWEAMCRANGWDPAHVVQYEAALAAMAKARGEST